MQKPQPVTSVVKTFHCLAHPTQQENLERLREMFPKKSSDDLMQALRFHGNVSAAALSLSTTVPEAHEVDVSSDDDKLLQPTFSPSKSKIVSLQSLLKELGKNVSQEKVKVTIEFLPLITWC